MVYNVLLCQVWSFDPHSNTFLFEQQPRRSIQESITMVDACWKICCWYNCDGIVVKCWTKESSLGWHIERHSFSSCFQIIPRGCRPNYQLWYYKIFGAHSNCHYNKFESSGNSCYGILDPQGENSAIRNWRAVFFSHSNHCILNNRRRLRGSI